MIVEFFGPPGAGKTTFAYALSERLRAQGHRATVVLSYRPGDGETMLDPVGAVGAVRRVARAVFETLVLICLAAGAADELAVAMKLVRILPPQNAIWKFRLGQYILRLSRHWKSSGGSEQIYIFDQAFVQAVCSLALFNRAASEASLRDALDVTPVADVVVHLAVPPEILEERLHRRLRREQVLERLFEANPQTNLQASPIIEKVNALLSSSGKPVISIDARDDLCLPAAIGRIEEAIVAKLKPPSAAAIRNENMGASAPT